MSKAEKAIAILNGVVGDHLDETQNELATSMAFYSTGGDALDLQNSTTTTASRICIFVHGLTDNESVWTNNKSGESFGSMLQRDSGLQPFYLRYNTGRHVSTNGAQLSDLMESLLQRQTTVEKTKVHEIVFCCHSMGGLVTRSACWHAVQNRALWVRRVSHVVFLGTPHQGSYWERLGNIVSTTLGTLPYLGVARDVANLRSAGIKDLRYGYVQDDDWMGLDADALLKNTKKKTDLLEWTTYHIATGTVTKNPRHVVARVLGDGLVGKESAEGRSNNLDHHLGVSMHQIQEFPGVSHCQLPVDPAVYHQVREWIAQPWEAISLEWETGAESSAIAVNASTRASQPISSRTNRKWSHCKGVASLLQIGVDKGAVAVEKLQAQVTRDVYSALHYVAPIRPVVTCVQYAHERIASSVYGAIRGVNHGVGEVAKLTFDTLDGDYFKEDGRREF